MNHASSFGEALLRLPTISRRSARKLRRTLATLNGPHAGQWRELLHAAPVTHWSALAKWIARDRARTPLTAALRETIQVAISSGSPNFLATNLKFIAARLREGAAPAIVLAWTEISAALGLYLYLPKSPASRSFPLDRVLQFADDDTQLHAAWYLAMHWTGAVEFFDDPRLRRLPPNVRECLFEIVSECEPARCIDAWPLLEAFDKHAAALAGEKLNNLAYAFWQIPHGAIPALLDRWLALNGEGRRGLAALAPALRTCSAETIRAFAALDARVFTQAGKMARRDNRQYAVCGGLAYCFLHAPHHTLAWLTRNADATFDLAVKLNALGSVRAAKVLRGARAHSLFSPPNPSALVAFDNLLTSNREVAQLSPHFRTWDLHFAGIKVLGKVAIEETAARLAADLPLLQVRLLEARIRAELFVSRDEHACLLHASLDFARGVYTRFLRTYERGHDPRLDHPANQQWLRRNNGFNHNAWLHPLKVTLPVEGLGDVTIAPETDPFEILKLGTYVDSCLGLGGCNTQNAVAVLLEVNKRVLFARNAKGHFLGRQIIAITRANALAVFRVYPIKAPKPLQDLFALYAEDLALQLGVPIANHADPAQTVEPIVVRHWYNDGLWERF